MWRMGVKKTYLKPDYSFSKTKDHEWRTGISNNNQKSVYYVNENLLYWLSSSLDTGKNYLSKLDLSKPTIWNMELSSFNPTKNLGHFDSIIFSLNSDPTYMPVKGFIAWTNFIVKSYNSVCDCANFTID